jgi:autotransporter-associated beta strand protein
MAGEAKANTTVQFNFSGGITDTSGQYLDYVQVGLFDDQAPQTVANFLRYVTNHIYDDTIIHRTVPQFIVQGGGFTPMTDTATGQVTALDPVLSYGPIQNEFSPSRSNVAGTIAMAKVGDNPNSATNQWFFNVADNSSNLDNQNGGFTVFGQVLGEGMQLIDAIDGLSTYNLNQYYDPNYAVDGPTGGPFTNVPLAKNSFIVVESVTVVPGPSAPTIWASAASGKWSDSTKWSNGVPNAVGAGAELSASTTAALTVTLDTPVTLGMLQFGNSGSSSVGYTLSGSGSNTLTLSNSGSGATIAVIDGPHVIEAPVVLADNLVVSGSGTLAFSNSSSITGGYSLTMSGTGGTLILSGSDTYTGGTNVNAGTLIATINTALPNGAGLTVGAGGTLIFDPSKAASSVAVLPGAVAVPEPSTIALLGVGTLGLIAYGWQRRRTKCSIPINNFTDRTVGWDQIA